MPNKDQIGYRFNNINQKSSIEKSNEQSKNLNEIDIANVNVNHNIMDSKNDISTKMVEKKLRAPKVSKKPVEKTNKSNKLKFSHKSEETLEKELNNFLKKGDQQIHEKDSNELSLDYRFSKTKEATELQKITNMIKGAEKSQETGAKLLSIFKTLLKNKEKKEYSKKQVIFKGINNNLKRINEDILNNNEKKLLHDLKQTKKFVGKRGLDKKFKSHFEELTQNMVDSSVFEKNIDKLKKIWTNLHDLTEVEQNKQENRNFDYENVEKEIENTENNVENGKLYEAEENLKEINEILKVKHANNKE